MSIELEGRRIAIIGGAGFIGHHLALALKARRAEVQVVDSLQVNNLLALASEKNETPNHGLHLRMLHQRLDLLHQADIPVHVQDARDYHVLTKTLQLVRPQIIVHLAAVSHAGRSNKDPYSTFDHSLRTLENALDFARDRVEQFVFLSSSMVYGDFTTDPVEETHPLNPIGIYGALKVAGERIVIAYQQVFELPYTIIRASALYGPRCGSRRVGQAFIEAAIGRRKIRIDGDGSDRLDFTYIDDLVEGICLTLERPQARNEIFNVTYGRARRVMDLIDIVRRHFPEVEVESIERDRLMPHRGTLSVAKAARLLDYEPRYPVETGFEKYIEWYKMFRREAPADTNA